jgi:hypothetical protein
MNSEKVMKIVIHLILNNCGKSIKEVAQVLVFRSEVYGDPKKQLFK